MKRHASLFFLFAVCAAMAAESPTPPVLTVSAPDKPKCDLCQSSAISLSGISETKWLEPAQRKNVLSSSFQLSNQNGDAFSLERLQGKPTAITFLYTRCENPNKCPLAASTLAKLQAEVEKAGVGEQVQLAVMTYDPEYDTARVLNNYAQERGIRCNANVMMLRPDPQTKLPLFESLNVTVNYDAKRVNIHGIQLMLLDKSGRFVRNYHTLIWDNQKVLADLKTLLAEK